MYEKPLVAIIGRPNVGKSSIFNRLIGKRRALVQDVPGITRDCQYGFVEWDGIRFTLVDTGGLEIKTKDRLQIKVTDQAKKTIKEADLILFVLDGRRGLTKEDWEWVEMARMVNKPKLLLVNKIDSKQQEIYQTEFYELGLDPLMPVSAETGRGISELLDQIKECLLEEGFYESDEGLIDHQRVEGEDDPDPGICNIAVIGRPNAGKSTLLNRLLGVNRSITDEKPGTTRDPIHSQIVHNNKTFNIVDTAGLRRKGQVSEAIEKFSIIKTLKSIDKAHCVLLLIDGIEGVSEQDAHVAGEAFSRNKALILLVNKWDVASKNKTMKEFIHDIQRKLHFTSYSPYLFISALTGIGVNKILPTMTKLFQQYSQRISTGKLNQALKKILSQHPLPVHRGKDIKIFYITQTTTAPPTFVIFANEPSKIHFSYQRYLSNALRTSFGFNEVPLRIHFRKNK